MLWCAEGSPWKYAHFSVALLKSVFFLTFCLLGSLLSSYCSHSPMLLTLLFHPTKNQKTPQKCVHKHFQHLYKQYICWLTEFIRSKLTTPSPMATPPVWPLPGWPLLTDFWEGGSPPFRIVSNFNFGTFWYMLDYFSVSIIHQILTWTTGSLMCVYIFAYFYTWGALVYTLIWRIFL